MNGEEEGKYDEKGKDLSFGETVETLKENKNNGEYELRFYLSNKTSSPFYDSDMPNSMGDLEEEITGP